MNTTFITLSIATIVTVIFIVQLGVLSLLSGAFHFLFARPSLSILKSVAGDNGFAFGYAWNGAREPAKFTKVKIRLYNPFGSPTQVDVSKEFTAHDSSFAEDLDMGSGMHYLLRAKGMKDALVEIELVGDKGKLIQYFKMKGRVFFEKYKNASITVDDFNKEHQVQKGKRYFNEAKRTFIAEPLPNSGKVLKIVTNPEFAGEFTAGATEGGAAVENFAVTKVWIEDGCIVCDACETIFPEVFDVTEDTCIIRTDAPLDNGILMTEAADACPVEIIKFTKA